MVDRLHNGENDSFSLFSYLKNNFFSDIETGIMVEVGAASPHSLSQSKYFRDNGWRCIEIEPNPQFAQLHRDCGNEIYEYACSDHNANSIDFYINSNPESFSSLGIVEDIFITCGYSGINELSISNIKVDVRRLDTILENINVSKIDYLLIDVEGWELDVMRGFTPSKYQPKIIILEVVGEHNHQRYNEYMLNFGYKFHAYDGTTGPNIIYYNSEY